MISIIKMFLKKILQVLLEIEKKYDEHFKKLRDNGADIDGYFFKKGHND